MNLLSWRKTNFLCITSILSPKSMSKLINVNCLHFIGCQNYTNVLTNRVLYQILVTALLPFFLSILHLLLQLSKIMLWSTVKLLLAIVMSIIFGPLKTLPRSSKSCDCVTFRVLKYLLSTFLLYTPHCHMIWSKQKCCLWSTGVSTESQNLTSVLHLRQDFLAARNMTHIDVGLARSYVKLLLSSWKTYMYGGIYRTYIVLISISCARHFLIRRSFFLFFYLVRTTFLFRGSFFLLYYLVRTTFLFCMSFFSVLLSRAHDFYFVGRFSFLLSRANHLLIYFLV